MPRIPGRLCKFKINPGFYNLYEPSLRHYYHVHVFEDVKPMQDYAARLERWSGRESDYSSWAARVSTYKRIRISPDGTETLMPKIGDILFYKKRLSPLVVSHEAVHAATSFLRTLERLKLGEHIDDDEECLAYCVGSITFQITEKLKKHNL